METIKKILNFINNMLSFNNNASSKRFVGVIASLFLILYMFIYPSDSSNNTVLILALTSLGLTSWEKIKR